MAKCVRCGRKVLYQEQDSETLCFQCNKEYQRYMKTHPLSNYNDVVKMQEEDRKRFTEFIEQNPSRRDVK